ncbi:MAG TPA: amidase family protein, partial [Actinomycetota bacterium]|nr:amidase family protein [Actinomycetota bacterium]
MSELCDLTGHELGQILQDGEAGATEIVESALRRIEALDDRLHAFLRVTGDLARQRAEEIDRQFQAGRELPPVAGIPLALKDVLCTKGIRTT